VDYTFDIEPGPKVEIAVEGLKISRGQIKKNVPVYEENALDDDLLNEGRRNLLNYVQGLGYFDAKVTVKKNPVSTGEMRVTYTIEAGERHKLVKLAITGNHIFSEDLLRARMQIQPAGRFLAHGLQPVAPERGCAQPNRQPVSRQRLPGRQDYPQGGR
jgi:outer membrane protein assembly factor BamA